MEAFRLFEHIRFVGHGYAYGALAEELNIGRQTVSDIVSEVTDAINTVLFADAFPTPTRQALEDCAMKTQQRYDYPRCGFHGRRTHNRSYFKKPKNAGSTYWNYKGFHSIILLAVCDCDYRFTAIDVGAPGRAGDEGVFRNSDIKTFYEVRDNIFPETEELNDVGPVQYHILVDGGFAQSHRYFRPFPEPMATTASKRRFNEKLSGARRMIESSFGILCKRFAILQRDLQVEPEKAQKLVTSLLVLHNLLVRRQDLLEGVERFAPARNSPLPDRFVSLQRTVRHAGSDSAKIARDRLVSYYDNLYGTPQ
ncbi:unnamed protein product [Cylicocyclus nassatus]|uniref:DDE Tnp4 domain-containing protein n=1 Tax=Cylicocyclus nassatus TaxID=53992 RepID=A0AA36H3N2_CYLNA|nr:unnamed protein product [Cylicocyclus nassatus]